MLRNSGKGQILKGKIGNSRKVIFKQKDYTKSAANVAAIEGRCATEMSSV